MLADGRVHRLAGVEPQDHRAGEVEAAPHLVADALEQLGRGVGAGRDDARELVERPQLREPGLFARLSLPSVLPGFLL